MNKSPEDLSTLYFLPGTTSDEERYLMICASAVKMFNLYFKKIAFCVAVPFWRQNVVAKDLATNLPFLYK